MASDTIAQVSVYGYAIIAAGWLIWMTPFLFFKRHTERATKVDRRARWGVLIVALAYSMLWQGRFWERSLTGWRVALSIFFFVLGIFLSWTARRALGRQWRIDAALSSDHELVRSGPYEIVRHPIYTSMLCVFLATGVIVAPWWLLWLSLLVFIAGTEIRVRIEDRLLSSRFGDGFRSYQRTVSAYIPFVR